MGNKQQMDPALVLKETVKIALSDYPRWADQPEAILDRIMIALRTATDDRAIEGALIRMMQNGGNVAPGTRMREILRTAMHSRNSGRTPWRIMATMNQKPPSWRLPRRA